MKQKNMRIFCLILVLYLTAAAAFLGIFYHSDNAETMEAEFPFSVTYEYLGKTHTYEAVYVCSGYHHAKYIGESNLVWDGYVDDDAQGGHNGFAVDMGEGFHLSVDLNFSPGWLMGDPACAGEMGEPTRFGLRSDEWLNEEELSEQDFEELGFRLISWEYPVPIENEIRPGAVMLSGEGAVHMVLLSLLVPVFVLIFVRRDKNQSYVTADRISLVLNILLSAAFVPMALIAAVLSEVVSTTPPLDLLMYLLPSVSILGIAASVALRRCGRTLPGLLVQFAGPALMGLIMAVDWFSLI